MARPSYTWVNVQPLITRLINRFNLQDTPIEAVMAWAMGKSIQPVTDIDKLLKTTNIDLVLHDISAASGYTTYYTVPAGKRWELLLFRRGSTTGNSAVSIKDDTSVVNLSNAGTAVAIQYLGPGFPLKEGWIIQMDNTNNGADSSIALQIWYTEEDAYE